VPALSVCLPRGGWRASVNRRPPNYLEGRVSKSDEVPRKHGMGLADLRWPCMSESRFIQRLARRPLRPRQGVYRTLTERGSQTIRRASRSTAEGCPK